MMWAKVKAFFLSDPGEIFAHAVVCAVLTVAIRWALVLYGLPPWLAALVAGAIVVAGVLVRELSQHGWDYDDMGRQSRREWIIPALIVAAIIMAVVA